MKKIYKKGITMVELLLVISVVGVLLLITLPEFYKLRENQALKAATSDILSTLEKAKSQTLASFNSSEYGVRFQSDRVIIFTGRTYSAGSGSNETILITTPVTISNVTLNAVSGTSGDMYFNRIYGVPSKTGTITITSPSFSKTITISATGVSSLN